MLHLPTSAYQKLKTVIVLILLFWQASYAQKIGAKEIDSTILQNCWTFPLINSTDIGTASDNVESLYISLMGGRLLSINLTTGEKHWEAELGGDIIALPVINGGTVYTAARYNSEQNAGNQSESTVILRALDKSTGVTQWQSALEPVEKLYLFNFENHIVAVGNNGQISSVSKIDGKIAWKKHLEMKLSAPPLAKKSEIYLGTDDNRILYVSLADGRIMEESKILAPPTVIIENTDKNKLIVGDRKGNVLLLAKKLKKNAKTIEWKLRNGAEISSLTLTAEGILISSFDNFIYLISENGGKLLWKKRFSGRIIAAPLVKDNYFIVSAADESTAVIAELNGGRSVNKIDLGDENLFTGLSLRSGELLIYSTLKGMFGYSLSGGCAISRKLGA